MKGWIGLAVVVLTLVGVLWVGGELHRQNCVQEHRTGCSVLPWVAGSEVRAASNRPWWKDWQTGSVSPGSPTACTGYALDDLLIGCKAP